MKKTTKLTLVRSLVLLGSCLAFSQVAQAVPKFLGTLTISFSGMPMFMGMGGGLGSSSMLMLMGSESVAQSSGDFAVLGARRGDAVLGPPMIMAGMSMGATVSIPSVPRWAGRSRTLAQSVVFPRDYAIRMTDFGRKSIVFQLTHT